MTPERSPFWPLPPDYPELTKEGQRQARVNAVGLKGTPLLEAASWAFFRETYLVPQGPQWYRTGYSPSPSSHYRWIMDWYQHQMLIHAAPRGTCKTTINLEDILRNVVRANYWEAGLFLATQKFCSDRLGRLMDQVEHNGLIIDDFGKLKGGRGYQWNRGSVMELKNGSRVSALPITGASLGTRPSGVIVLDDVEKSDDLVITPSDLRENFENFFFNAIYPMARSPGFRIPLRIIGTLYNRRMFIWWLYSTKDERIAAFFKRVLMNVVSMDWDVMGSEWQAEEKKRLGPSAYAAQCMNEPGSEAERMLNIHPELCTYWIEDSDGSEYHDPFRSEAVVVTHQLAGWNKSHENANPVPQPRRVIRKWRDVVGKMRRFITVDSARTTKPDADYSVVHVMGFENSEAHRDTLYSLDCWMGHKRPEEVVRIIYQMAIRWGVTLVGVEAYPVLSEFYERVRDNLPSLYGAGDSVPRILPIKFPPHVEKADKIMGLEWRFNQFRIKLPLDRMDSGLPGDAAFRRLRYEVENATEDLALLDHDDVIDTLAMSQRIGKPHQALAADIAPETDPIKLMRVGTYTHEATGLPVFSSMNAKDIPPDVLRDMLDRRYDQALEDLDIDADASDIEALGYMGLPPDFLG